MTMTALIALDEERHHVDATAAMGLHTRALSPELIRRFERYSAEMFAALGMDMDSPSTADTPRRFVRALIDATTGYEGDPKLVTVFDNECPDGADCRHSQVIEGPIPFYALCEHHALPFHGMAYVGYIAHDRIIGISKLTRLVRLFAQRFTVQERLGQQIASALEGMVNPHGVAVYLESHHLCVQMRGVHETSSLTRTTAWRGEYDENPAQRAEFFVAAGLSR